MKKTHVLAHQAGYEHLATKDDSRQLQVKVRVSLWHARLLRSSAESQRTGSEVKNYNLLRRSSTLLLQAGLLLVSRVWSLIYIRNPAYRHATLPCCPEV